MRVRGSIAVLVPIAVALGCGTPGTPPGTPSPPPSPQVLETPAGDGAGEPNLSRLPDGRALLSWVEPLEDGGHALRFATRPPAGEWSAPRTVAEGRDWFVNWADFPSVHATPDGTLFAHWLAKSGPGTYAYDVRVSISPDGGETWREPFVLHRDGTEAEHGFVSMVPVAADRMGFVWLDGRNTVGAEGELRSHGEGGAEMSVYFATVGADGSRGDETPLDGRVCDCCQTAAARAGEALLVAYRDRSPDEVRDTSVVRRVGSAWSEPAPVAADGWRIDGCPVNGPALDAGDEGRSALAWFTAPEERAAVKVAFSGDAGETWSNGVAVDGGRPLGRVDVALLTDGSALVSWLEQVGRGAELRLRRVLPDGRLSEVRVVSATQAARASGFPRMLVAGGELLLAWRHAGDPARIRTAAAPVS